MNFELIAYKQKSRFFAGNGNSKFLIQNLEFLYVVSLRRYDLVSGSKGMFSVRLKRTTPNEFSIISNEHPTQYI